MEDTDVHSGIPLGHKFFAFLIAAAVAAAGCAWQIDQSRGSASTAALAFNSDAAQRVDPGLAAARNPAVALAESLLNDQTVANLAKQAHLASSTPAGQIGEFRSDLQLTQSPGLLGELRSELHLAQPSAAPQLQVRFDAPDSSDSMAVTNAVAQVLAAGSSASGAMAAPPQSAPANQGRAHPPAATGAASQPAPPNRAPASHPLSDALNNLGAQLTATDQRVERLAEGGGFNSESRQQSLLRTEVAQARTTLRDLRAQYPKELADPSIGGRFDEIQQALDSILSGGRRGGFNAVGVSRRELDAERSELSQAITIVTDEAKKIQIAEAAQAPSSPQPSAPAAPPSAVASTSPAAGPSSSSGVQEQNLSSTPAAGGEPLPSSQGPFSIVHLAAASGPRLPLWPAIVAGAVCGLLYLGLAALAFRRRGGDDVYLHLGTSSTPGRMITPPDPVRIEEPRAAPPEPARFEREAAREADRPPRQRAAFVFQPAPEETGGAPVGWLDAPPETPAAHAPKAEPPAEIAAAPAEAANPAPPVEAIASLPGSVAEPVASITPASESVPAPVESAIVPAAPPGPILQPQVSPADHGSGVDPVAERIRKGLAETTIGRSLGAAEPSGRGEPPSTQPPPAENPDWLDDWLSPSGESRKR